MDAEGTLPPRPWRRWVVPLVAVLLLAGLVAGAYAVQVAQQPAWDAVFSGVDSDWLHGYRPPVPSEPPALVVTDRTLDQWDVSLIVTQERSEADDVWRLTARVEIPAQAEALRALRAGFDNDAGAVADAVLGEVSVSGDPLRPSSYVITQPGATAPAVLTFVARFAEPARHPWYVTVGRPTVSAARAVVPSRWVRVESDSYEIAAVRYEEPIDQRPHRVEFADPAQFGTSDLTVQVGHSQRFDLHPAQIAETLWYVLLTALVLLAVAWLVGKTAPAPYAGRLRAVVLAVTGLHAVARALVALAEVGDWLDFGPPSTGFARVLKDVVWPGPYVVLPVVFLVVAPLVAVSVSGRGDSWRTWIFAAGLPAAVLVGVLLRLPDVAPGRHRDLCVGAAILLTTVTVAVAARLTRIPVVLPVAAVVGTALFATVAPLAETTRGTIGSALATGTVFAAAAAMAGAIVGLAKYAGVDHAWPGRWYLKVAVVAAVGVAAYPYRYAASGWYLIPRLAFRLAGLGTTAIAVAAVYAIRGELQGEDTAGRAKRLRLLGVAFALLTFFPATATVRYVPVLLLTGGALLYWWALSKPLEEVPVGRVEPAEHARNVAAVLKARPAERTAARLRRKLRDKVETGEDLTYAAAEAKVAAIERIAIRARQERGVPSVEKAAFGSFVDEPWQEAKRFARIGFVAGLPWVLLTASDVVTRSSRGAYAVLGALSDTPVALGRWAAYGLLFGACFPLVRGRTGLNKGFTLFVVTSAPLLAAAFATGQLSEQRADVALAVSELFLEFMVLGLLADLAALREAGRYGLWRIAEVHNIRAVLAWGTGVTVAFGTALSTAIVSGATAFLVGLLQPSPPPAAPTPIPTPSTSSTPPAAQS